MIRSNVVSGFVCLGFGAYVWWLAQAVPPMTLTDNLGGRFFPQLISIGFMIASLGLIITGFFGIEISGGTVAQDKSVQPRAEGDAAGGRTVEQKAAEAPAPRFGAGEVRLLAFVATMLAYTFLLPLLGYVVASALTFAVMIVIAGERRPLRVALGAVAITMMLYALFGVVFNMRLPVASLY